MPARTALVTFPFPPFRCSASRLIVSPRLLCTSTCRLCLACTTTGTRNAISGTMKTLANHSYFGPRDAGPPAHPSHASSTAWGWSFRPLADREVQHAISVGVGGCDRRATKRASPNRPGCPLEGEGRLTRGFRRPGAVRLHVQFAICVGRRCCVALQLAPPLRVAPSAARRVDASSLSTIGRPSRRCMTAYRVSRSRLASPHVFR
ncbi:hypothetical protein LX36DRAFT_262078 [Colletotrichum falcatum]|nr:hypothetical protein LX36DRAFT_262078 [Colletotrichum falcatum]